MTTRRRAVLLGATAVTADAGIPAPAIAQGIKELKLVTSWTQKGMSGLQNGAERLAQSITAMSDGHLKVVVYPADSLVRAFEVFEHAHEFVGVLTGERALEPVEELRGRIDLVVVFAIGKDGHLVQI